MSAAEFAAEYATPLLMLEPVASLPALEQAAGKKTRTVGAKSMRERMAQVEIISIEMPDPENEDNDVNVAVGRTSGCDIRLVSNAVSKLHAVIERPHGTQKYFLVDKDSHNGTWLNGNKLEGQRPAALVSGDVLDFARAFRCAFLDAHTLYEQLRYGRIATHVRRRGKKSS